jgi:hypothetical protein
MERLLKAVPGFDAMVLGLEEASGLLAEVFEDQVIDGDAEDSEFLRQEVGLLQVVQGRNELAHGEIAGGAEDDHDARARGFASRLELVIYFGNG